MGMISDWISGRWNRKATMEGVELFAFCPRSSESSRFWMEMRRTLYLWCVLELLDYASLCTGGSNLTAFKIQHIKSPEILRGHSACIMRLLHYLSSCTPSSSSAAHASQISSTRRHQYSHSPYRLNAAETERRARHWCLLTDAEPRSWWRRRRAPASSRCSWSLRLLSFSNDWSPRSGDRGTAVCNSSAIVSCRLSSHRWSLASSQEAFSYRLIVFLFCFEYLNYPSPLCKYTI